MSDDKKKKDEKIDKKDDEKKDVEKKEEKEIRFVYSPAQVLRSNVLLLDKAVKNKDTRLLVGRVLRQTAGIRKKLQPSDARAFVLAAIPEGSRSRKIISQALEQLPTRSASDDAEMDVDGPSPASTSAPAAPPAAPAASADKKDAAASDAKVQVLPAPDPVVSLPSALPEVEAYGYLLALMLLVDGERYEAARDVAVAAVEDLRAHNRRTLDVLQARILHYYSWAHERLGQAAAIRPALHALHRTASLRHDEAGSETLLNLLLRSYVAQRAYGMAEALRARAQVPDTFRSSQQHCRYLYYLGRIRAIQLSYSEARDCLAQAARKAPEGARGFRIVVSKWLVLVRLLLGEIPERTEFTQLALRKALEPYFELTQAVRLGDLSLFRSVTESHGAGFAADGTAHLITRLRHNVIRAGLRRISLAYSRISLSDVSSKLGLGSHEDTELIVAKAIRDGAVDAELDHEGQSMTSRAVADLYSTSEPQAAFHQRIAFCLDLHNEAVRAMRYDVEPSSKPAAPEAGKEELGDDELAELATEMDDF